jgi:hypothetical protein
MKKIIVANLMLKNFIVANFLVFATMKNYSCKSDVII